MAALKHSAKLAELDRVIALGWDANQDTVVEFWKSNQEAIELARKASNLPRARFEADLIPLLCLASGFHARPFLRWSGGRRSRRRTRLHSFSRAVDLTDWGLA